MPVSQFFFWYILPFVDVSLISDLDYQCWQVPAVSMFTGCRVGRQFSGRALQFLQFLQISNTLNQDVILMYTRIQEEYILWYNMIQKKKIKNTRIGKQMFKISFCLWWYIFLKSCCIETKFCFTTHMDHDFQRLLLKVLRIITRNLWLKSLSSSCFLHENKYYRKKFTKLNSLQEWIEKFF